MDYRKWYEDDKLGEDEVFDRNKSLIVVNCYYECLKVFSNEDGVGWRVLLIKVFD